MKEDLTSERNHAWIVWLSIIAVIILGVGIFFYYTFLRQAKSELIEAVPTDALFIFEINDNKGFVKDIPTLQPYFNEMFGMDALAAYETVHNKLPKGIYDVTISGHQSETCMHLLFNTRIDKATFKRLLRALSIDPANFQSFENHKVYTYGTNYKSLKFTYYNHILSVSDDVELLRKAVIQHTHPKNLISDENFNKLYQLTLKNRKQNWLVINNNNYFDFLKGFFKDEVNQKMAAIKGLADWSAFQIRMAQNELFLAGYTTAQSDDFKEYVSQQARFTVPETILPFSTDWYYKVEKKDYAGCYFSVTEDSTQHHRYLAVQRDSIKDHFAKIDSEQLELIQSNHPNGIYPCSDSLFPLDISPMEGKDFTVFTIVNGYYLFATSEAALNHYWKSIQQQGTIVDNRGYKFSKSNVASSNILEYAYYNGQDRTSLAKNMTTKGVSGKVGHKLSIFSISCSNVNSEYANVNIYISFAI